MKVNQCSDIFLIHYNSYKIDDPMSSSNSWLDQKRIELLEINKFIPFRKEKNTFISEYWRFMHGH